jgi:hypothetical protein
MQTITIGLDLCTTHSRNRSSGSRQRHQDGVSLRVLSRGVSSEDLGSRHNRLHPLVELGVGAGRRFRPARSVAIPLAAHRRLCLRLRKRTWRARYVCGSSTIV